jgi:hypothetical protein
MKIKTFVIPVTAAAVVGAAVVAPGALFGAATTHHMVGYAGGTAIQVLGATVRSDLTSESSVDTNQTGVTHTNTAAAATVPSVASVGVINTAVKTTDLPGGGAALTTAAQTASINLFNGAIVAQAITTTDIARVDSSNNTSADISTTFVGLKIAGIKLPVVIPKNFKVTIPNVATVILNGSFVAAGAAGSGTIMTLGAGLYVSLLKPRGPHPIGTQIFVNPTYGAIGTVTPVTGATLGGYAYGTKVMASAGKLLNAESGPTAQVSMPVDGTAGKDKVNTTATVKLDPILNLGVITDTANGVKSDGTNYSTMTTKLAHVNLLGGLITADALTGVAKVEQLPGGGTKATATTSLVNLVVAGAHIDVNTKANTVIPLLNVGTLTIRGQATTANQALVHVLDIKVSTANYGLPVGAEVEVGTAAAWLLLP